MLVRRIALYEPLPHGVGDEDGHDGDGHAADDVRGVMYADVYARDAHEDSQYPKNCAQTAVPDRADHRDRSDKERVVGREAVIRGMRDKRSEMADDEWAGIEIEMVRDLPEDEREDSSRHGEEREAHPGGARPPQEVKGENDDGNDKEVFRGEDEKSVHMLVIPRRNLVNSAGVTLDI